MHRLFVAVRPPEHIRDLLIDAMDESPVLRWVDDEQLHLTLRFIGEVERPVANEVADALERIDFPAFTIRISGVGRFERRSGGALWAGIDPPQPVAKLAAKVDRACIAAGLEPETRAFRPHITLARWTRGSAEAARVFERRNSDLASEPFAVDGFILYESRLSRHGPHYEEVATFALVKS